MTADPTSGRSRSTSTPDPAVGCDQRQSDAEWAASLSVADVDLMLNRCVQAKDFQGISAALHLLAVKDPNRAETWRNTLLLAVEVGRARHEET